MAPKNAAITIDATLAATYNAAPKIQQKRAQAAMRQVLQAASATTPVPRLSKQETALFLRINRHLTPEQQGRYDALRTKREEETLTPNEHAELLQCVEEIATIWSDRLQALLELARLRRVSPQHLMQQLSITPRAYAI